MQFSFRGPFFSGDILPGVTGQTSGVMGVPGSLGGVIGEVSGANGDLTGGFTLYQGYKTDFSAQREFAWKILHLCDIP